MLEYFAAHRAEVLTLTAEHMWLVGISMGLAVAVGVPLGVLLAAAGALRLYAELRS